jgi:hypothetical protein
MSQIKEKKIIMIWHQILRHKDPISDLKRANKRLFSKHFIP